MFVGQEMFTGETCDNFNGYFNLNLHERKTRNSEKFLKLSSIKLEFTKNLSSYMVLRFTMTCL